MQGLSIYTIISGSGTCWSFSRFSQFELNRDEHLLHYCVNQSSDMNCANPIFHGKVSDLNIISKKIIW